MTARTSSGQRDYSQVVVPAHVEPEQRRTALIDALWEALSPQGVSWIGFYSKASDRDEMILEECRDKPACSPIGLHGVCGRGWRESTAVVVNDVAVLGKDYVACDPRDRSEVVVPIFAENGDCEGVLDADSFEIGAFSEHDARSLDAIVRACGISVRDGLSPLKIVTL